ncbi:hypothetical protein [Halocola ammonii]
MNRTISICVAVVGLLLISQSVEAQCAMCEAVAESASEDNKNVAEGLNKGIIYLMFVPYLLFAIVGFVFFRKKIAYFYRDLIGQH